MRKNKNIKVSSRHSFLEGKTLYIVECSNKKTGELYLHKSFYDLDEMLYRIKELLKK